MNSMSRSTRTGWFKSSYSQRDTVCVETRFAAEGVAVRDSKDPDGGIVEVGRSAWHGFVRRVKEGSLDLSHRS